MLTAALLVVVQVASVADVASPRPSGWVTDQADVLSADVEASLDQIAEELHGSLGVELAVVTVDDVPGTPKAFATALFNRWGIGSVQNSTGVLVLLVMGQHRLEGETGDGIERALPPDWLADMQASTMVPRFKRKDFAGGLVDGVRAIAEHLHAAGGESLSNAATHEYRDNGAVAPTGTVDPALDPTGVAPDPTATREPATYQPLDDGRDEDDGTPIGALVAGGLGLVGAGGGGALFARHRKRQRTCVACQPPRPMIALSEIEDDTHLDRGQITEEQIGSVDYEVLVCPGCQASRTLRHGKWFSGYGTCSGCGYKTMKSSSSTIVSATYDHGGQVEVTESCRNCAHTRQYTRYTSQLTRSTSGGSSWGSSGSSGGSSHSSGFGGGHSSGGGAGSSW